MIFLFLLRVCLLVFGFWFIITQVIIPSINGTKLFPIFSRTRADIEKEKTKIHEELELLRQRKEIEQLKKDFHGNHPDHDSSNVTPDPSTSTTTDPQEGK